MVLVMSSRSVIGSSRSSGRLAQERQVWLCTSTDIVRLVFGMKIVDARRQQECKKNAP
jgi:hypothetical protein